MGGGVRGNPKVLGHFCAPIFLEFRVEKGVDQIQKLLGTLFPYPRVNPEHIPSLPRVSLTVINPDFTGVILKSVLGYLTIGRQPSQSNKQVLLSATFWLACRGPLGGDGPWMRSER